MCFTTKITLKIGQLFIENFNTFCLTLTNIWGWAWDLRKWSICSAEMPLATACWTLSRLRTPTERFGNLKMYIKWNRNNQLYRVRLNMTTFGDFEWDGFNRHLLLWKKKFIQYYISHCLHLRSCVYTVWLLAEAGLNADNARSKAKTGYVTDWKPLKIICHKIKCILYYLWTRQAKSVKTMAQWAPWILSEYCRNFISFNSLDKRKVCIKSLWQPKFVDWSNSQTCIIIAQKVRGFRLAGQNRCRHISYNWFLWRWTLPSGHPGWHSSALESREDSLELSEVNYYIQVQWYNAKTKNKLFFTSLTLFVSN